MKIGIMQPYLFPYIGYYSLIDYVDMFVFFDTPQYIKKGWINRNRILKADGTPTFFTVPVEKCARETAIKDVRVNQQMPWRETILGQLTVYKRRAPFYDVVTDMVREVFGEQESISKLCIDSLKESCRYIGLNTPFQTFSEMELPIGEVQEPDEWALEITKAMKYETYVNPPGGMSFFDREKYRKAGITLEFLEANLSSYNQRMGRFEPGLSMLDVMLFVEPAEIRGMLKDYVIK